MMQALCSLSAADCQSSIHFFSHVGIDCTVIAIEYCSEGFVASLKKVAEF